MKRQTTPNKTQHRNSKTEQHEHHRGWFQVYQNGKEILLNMLHLLMIYMLLTRRICITSTRVSPTFLWAAWFHANITSIHFTVICVNTQHVTWSLSFPTWYRTLQNNNINFVVSSVNFLSQRRSTDHTFLCVITNIYLFTKM